MWQIHQKKYHNDPAKLLPTFEQFLQSARERFLNSNGADEKVLNAKSKKAKTRKPKKVYIGSFNDDHHHHHH